MHLQSATLIVIVGVTSEKHHHNSQQPEDDAAGAAAAGKKRRQRCRRVHHMGNRGHAGDGGGGGGLAGGLGGGPSSFAGLLRAEKVPGTMEEGQEGGENTNRKCERSTTRVAAGCCVLCQVVVPSLNFSNFCSRRERWLFQREGLRTDSTESSNQEVPLYYRFKYVSIPLP